jgi:hypothetical protein
MNAFLLNFFLFIFSSVFSNDFILMTTLYNEKNDIRKNEFLYTLEKNINSGNFEKIIIFFEKLENECFISELVNRIGSQLVEIVPINSRPSFSFLFGYANQNYIGKKVVISNADIYFDNSLKKIDNKYLYNSLVSLNRYDLVNLIESKARMMKCGIEKKRRFYSFSADSWIFLSPIHVKISDVFLMGTMFCEKFINNFIQHKITIKNPSLDVKSFHVHNSEIRNYKFEDKYPQYRQVHVKVTRLNEVPEIIYQ